MATGPAAFIAVPVLSLALRLGGSWVGGALGGSVGAKYGALIGTAIFPGIGTAIGGFAGGLLLGVAGSYGGDWFAQKVIDITEVI